MKSRVHVSKAFSTGQLFPCSRCSSLQVQSVAALESVFSPPPGPPLPHSRDRRAQLPEGPCLWCWLPWCFGDLEAFQKSASLGRGHSCSERLSDIRRHPGGSGALVACSPPRVSQLGAGFTGPHNLQFAQTSSEHRWPAAGPQLASDGSASDTGGWRAHVF